jgi:cell division protein FtsI (penicillin-binding protein 3)
VIKRSSNVGAVKIARKLGKDALHEALERYGFGAETGIELPGERTGMIRDPRRWGELGLASISFGYGLTVTPLQVAAGLAAIGNGGTYFEPRLIREVSDASGAVLYRHQANGRPIMSESTARAMWPMLASVFDKGRHGGTARALDSPSFAMGGKTGTARKVDPQTHEYSQEMYVSSFAGLAPIDAPRIAVVVVIDEPRGEHYYGGVVAGPAFVRVVDETLRYLGVPPRADADAAAKLAAGHDHGEPERERESELPAIADAEPDDEPDGEPDGEPLRPGPLSGDMVMIPDFRGMSVKRALDVARDAGVAVEIQGSGRAVEQTPAPGPAPWPGECRIVFARSPAARQARAADASSSAGASEPL